MRPNARRIALVIICSPLLCLLLVVLAAAVPSGRVSGQLLVAAQSRALQPEDYTLGTTGRVDHFTECVALSEMQQTSPKTPLVSRALRASSSGSCSSLYEQTASPGHAVTPRKEAQYLRFWHGYSVITRPLIALFGLAATRLILQAMVLGALVWLGYVLRNAIGSGRTLIAILPFALSTDLLHVGEVLPHAIGTATALASAAAVVMYLGRSPWSVGRAFSVAALAGGIYAFLTFMIDPPVGWLLTIFAAAAVGGVGTRRVKAAAAAGAGWIVGYAYIWASKWILASLVFGPKAVRRDVVDQIALRVDGAGSIPGLGFGDGLIRAWHAWLRIWPSAPRLLLLVAVALLISLLVARRRPDWAWLAATMLAAVAAASWLLAANEHTWLHELFSYRSIPLALGILMSGLVPRVAADRAEVAPTAVRFWGRGAEAHPQDITASARTTA